MEMSWQINQLKKLEDINPIMITGLPGMGNVGKIAVDFLIDRLKAEKVFEIYSHSFPNCVFVNEDNLVELPVIEVFQKKLKNKTLVFITGDIQPLDEKSCYEFCNEILDIFEKNKGKEIITLGGIGLKQIPKNPKLYCTGNDSKIIDKYKSRMVSNNIHGVVGPIVGVSGLLIGLAGRRKIPAISLLAETFGHPTFLGIKGSREILKVLNKKLGLKLNLKELDDEINEIEKQIRKTFTDRRVNKKLPIQKIDEDDLNYIG